MREQLSWYVRRLQAMSPREIAERARRTLGHRVDAVTFHVLPAVWRSRWQPSASTLFATEPRSVPVGFLTAERASELETRIPAEAAALIARADEILDGRFRFFGYPEVRVTEQVPADVDPFTGRAWPERHGKLLDYRHRAVGDPKWIWELNRCQELPVLVAAWLLSGRATYGETAARRLLSWIAAHSPGRGIAWSGGFEAGIRGISLAVTYDALRGSGFLTADEQARVARSLWQHARFIERDPSTGSSANNHRVGELVGLVVIGSLAPELEGAASWVESGVDALAREAEGQIRSDGTGVEQAFSYHVFVVDLLLVAIASLECAGHAAPPEIASALERSGDALWAQLGTGEPAPTYGDTDDGRAIVLDGHGLRDPRGAASAIAARFAHARSARTAGQLDATAFWLFGAQGADTFAHVDESPEPGSLVLPDGGLTILRAGRLRAILDHGPHGHLSIAAHAHADALAIGVSLGEDELVVDPGVGSYFARPAQRDAFRGTGFHATVLVDDTNSSEPGGPFLWTTRAESRLLAADVHDGLVVAEHQGYRRLPDPVTHRRAVVLLADAVLVVDRLEAEHAHTHSQRWPLHPDLDLAELHAKHVVARGRDDVGFVLAVAASSPVGLTVTRGERDPWSGWWSGRLESVSPAWMIAADVEAVGSVEIAALVVPFQSESPPDIGLELGERNEATTVRVRTPAGEETLDLELASNAVRVRRDAMQAVAAR